MANISYGERIRRARDGKGWSQKELGAKLSVSQGAVSLWENGQLVPNHEQQARIRELLGLEQSEATAVDDDQSAETSEQIGLSAFGSWLNRTRVEKKLSVAELSSKAGVSVPAIYNIESGRIENPRAATVRRLEQALGKDVPAETKKEIHEEATVEGVGEFFEFDPHDKEDWPEVPGIYVLYDVSERPIYVGQGGNIKTRIQDHEEKFWFKAPIVTTAAYIEVKDSSLRKKIETILIRFLKKNAVINKQHVKH